jgi:hypothetical protein
VAVRKADLDLYDAIVGELASVEKRIKDSEARTLFRLLNVCPAISANAPPMQLPLEARAVERP